MLRRLARWRRESSGDRRTAAIGPPTVTLIENGRPVAWRRVDRIDEARPEDRAFAVDPATGTLVFGDGVRGRRPAEGQLIRVRHEGAGPSGAIAGMAIRAIEYEFPFYPKGPARTPPGMIRQVMTADLWVVVETTAGGERLTPLVGWALLDPYVPPYREGGESYAPAEQTVRGLIARPGGAVRIVDELAPSFAGYRRVEP